MATRIRDYDGSREILLDGNSIGCPDSVFLESSDGRALEFDKGIFLHAIKQEFGLYSLEIPDSLRLVA